MSRPEDIVIRGGGLTANDVLVALQSHYKDGRSVSLELNTSSSSSSAKTDSEEHSTGYDESTIIVSTASTAGSSAAATKTSAELEDLHQLLDAVTKKLDQKEHECKEMSETAQKALATVQTFHMQQKQLFDEFQLLRQRYDEQRENLQDVLWAHCGRHHPELKAIPAAKPPEFAESDVRIGDFAIGDVLGEGQFATVFNCHRLPGASSPSPSSSSSSSKEFALKIIRKEKITTFGSLKHVSNEIEILSSLNCDQIVRIEEILQTKSKLYIITEKGGLDLFEFFDEHPDGVCEAWAREIMACVLRGVLYIHAQGICHRDLKPENILVTFDKASGRCVDLKLCDFGLATRFEEGKYLSDFCGSPGFFAPEMIIRGTYYGDKADIWSCGCILLELTMGHEKFCDEWMTAYDYEVLQDKADFAKEIRLTIERLVDALSFSDELNELVCKFLRLRSSLRPGIREVCADAWFGGIISLSPSASVQSPSPQMSPSVTNRHSVYGIEDAEGGTEVDPELLQKSFQSMSERERHMYEKHNEHIVGDDRHHLLHLPPIEPQTPNMQAARKILKKGADLVSHVSASGAGKRQPLSPDANAAGKGFPSSGLDSPDLSSSPLSPSDRLNLQREWSSSAKMGSPSRTGSASQLPGLSEAAQEKDEDDEGLTGAGAASASSRQKTRKKSTDNAAAAAATAAAAMAAQAERDASSPPFIRSPRPGPDARWS